MAKTTDSIIADIIAREGDPTNDPKDKGGPTVFGISKVSNPEAFKSGPPTQEQARQIYLNKYVLSPGFDKIKDGALKAQLVDYGVNSGPAIAIMKLQGILKVTQDGVLGPETLAALDTIHPEEANNLLIAERVKMLCNICVKNPSQLAFLNGWIARAFEFLE